MNGEAVAFIFARGGSKGVPRKNVRLLAGRPLIAYAIEQARAARAVRRVVVSTDDAEIAEAARRFGAEVPFMRPAELAGDASPEWLAWQHALSKVEREEGRPLEIFLSVPTTAPLRAPADIDACAGRLARGDVDVVVTVTAAHRNPYFNMVTVDGRGHARLFAEAPVGGFSFRQEAPPVFDMTTVCYAVRPAFLRDATGLFGGRVGVIEVPPERALDLDTELDFRIAECLLGTTKS